MPHTAAERIEVAVGVILEDDRVLVSQRRAGTHLAGLWEFPGGKIETGEPPELALRRELKEELDIRILQARPWFELAHSYPEKDVLLKIYQVLSYQGEARGVEGQAICWQSLDCLADLAFPPANLAIVKRIGELISA